MKCRGVFELHPRGVRARGQEDARELLDPHVCANEPSEKWTFARQILDERAAFGRAPSGPRDWTSRLSNTCLSYPDRGRSELRNQPDARLRRRAELVVRAPSHLLDARRTAPRRRLRQSGTALEELPGWCRRVLERRLQTSHLKSLRPRLTTWARQEESRSPRAPLWLPTLRWTKCALPSSPKTRFR